MNKQDLWNRITCNGCREMTEERFYQALDELQSEAIPATERERMIGTVFCRFYLDWSFGKDVNDNNVWDKFLSSKKYQSIPPALNFEQELEKRFAKISINEARSVNERIPTYDFMYWMKNQLLKGKQ